MEPWRFDGAHIGLRTVQALQRQIGVGTTPPRQAERPMDCSGPRSCRDVVGSTRRLCELARMPVRGLEVVPFLLDERERAE